MLKRLIAAAFLPAALALAAPSSLLAQSTGAARGKIVDEKGQGIQDAVVTVEFLGGITRKFDTKTNKKGEFTQVGLQPGPYKITASKEGYQGSFIDVRIALGEPTQIPDLKIVTKAAAQAAASSEADKAGTALRELFAGAAKLAEQGKGDEAIAAYQEVLSKNPNVAEAHYNIGFLLAKKKDWPGAQAAFQKALEVRPGYGEALIALAGVYQESGQAEKATELLAKAAADNPKDAKVQFNLGIFNLNSGHSEEALASFQKSAELDPAFAETYYYLGTIAVGQNKIPDAIANLEKYLSMNPTQAQNVATAQGLLQALKPKK